MSTRATREAELRTACKAAGVCWKCPAAKRQRVARNGLCQRHYEAKILWNRDYVAGRRGREAPAPTFEDFERLEGER